MTDNCDEYLFYDDVCEDISDWDEEQEQEPDIHGHQEQEQEYNNHFNTISTQNSSTKNENEQQPQPTKELNIPKNVELSTCDTDKYLIQKYSDTDKYGLSDETVILLCKKKVNINTIIKYHGIKCSLLHAAIYCYHLMKIPFSNFLTLHKPIIGLKDEYGRSALVLSVWNLSTSLTAKDAKMVGALIEYGFNPFLQFRGIRIADKLRKIKERHCKQKIQPNGRRSFSIKNNLNKSVRIIDDILCKISYKIRQMEYIHTGLHNLVIKNILIYDIGKIITNYVGICHYADCIPPKPKTRARKI